MKKTIILAMSSFLVLPLFAQTEKLLKQIGESLVNYQDYQAHCIQTFSFPYGGAVKTFEQEMIVQKNADDTLCGFFYFFNTNEKYRSEAGDFSMYFNKSYYSSYKGEIKKTAIWEKPEEFQIKRYSYGQTPPIFERPQLFQKTPYQIGEMILETLEDVHVIISQKPDTLIDEEACLHFTLDVLNSYGGGTLYDMVFQKQTFYPVLHREEYHRKEKDEMPNQFLLTKYSNTKINSLSSVYFTEDNLLGKNWWSKSNKEENTKRADLTGKQAPEWDLPVFGSADSLSIKSLKGKYVLLEFTATWCGHCIRAAEFMNGLEGLFENEDKIAIVSIFSSPIDTKTTIENFAKRNNLKSTIVYGSVDIEERYNIRGYPCFLILSPEGKILKTYPGYSEKVNEEIISILKKSSDI